MRFSKKLSVVVLASLMTACATPAKQESEQLSGTLPDWVVMPFVEGGLADTQCVANNADMGILKGKATAMARAELARQLTLKVQAMDKTYASLTESNGKSVAGGAFESVSKQITNQVLSGSRLKKLDYVIFPDDTTKLCALIAITPTDTDEIYKAIVSSADQELSPKDDAILYQEFKAHKAQEELVSEIDKQS